MHISLRCYNINILKRFAAGFRTLSPMLAVVCLCLLATEAGAQVQNYDETHRGSVYFNVGEEIQFYNASKIHIQQDALNNNYNLNNVKGVDNGAGIAFSPAQLSYRLGYYFNYNQDEGIELSFDPCKYYIQDNQSVSVSGTKSGSHVESSVLFSKSTGNYYYLSNGLGKIMFNFTGRYGVYRKESYNFAIDLLGKAGVGVVMPNVSTSFDNQQKPSGTQLGGFNMGIEMGARWISHRHFTLDLTYKFSYAMLSNLKVYDGWASQNISGGAVVLAAGVFLPTTKNNPLFDKGWAHRKRITHTRPMYLIDSQY